MSLAAHPDDEDGATLAYYRKIENMKAVSVFFTRGEGGQNEIGSELYAELASIRTRETREASKLLGTDICFLGFPDFGFSKTAKETFVKWGGEEKVLEKLVYAIRSVKPDVIITNHDTVTTGPRRQHGNHQAVGITAYRAIEKAADPKYHPEQLRNGATPWRVRKLFFRIGGSSPDTLRDSLVRINAQQPFTPTENIEELAWRALSQHHSQGMAKMTIDSIPMQFRRHWYRLVKADHDYGYDDDDLFVGLTPLVRNSALPKEASDAMEYRFSMFVSPDHTSAGTERRAPGKQPVVRPVVLTLINPTGNSLKIEVLAHAGSVRVFQKSYSMAGLPDERLIDTLNMHLEDIPAREKTVRFVAAAKGASGQSASANAEILLKPLAGSYSKDAFAGLVRTYDNTLQETMQTYDIRFSLIDSTMLAFGNLDQFSVILLDIRAYAYRPDAVLYNSRLLEYARNGGNIVVFYQKTGDWNGKNVAPYPLRITGERVTEEDAPVTVLLPEHPLLSLPNRITEKDWSDWMQERNIYLPSDDTAMTSGNYQRLLAMSDEGEHQPSTSLLWAKVDKGSYTYVSLALYRQLRNLQDGAVKLFFNMISQPANR